MKRFPALSAFCSLSLLVGAAATAAAEAPSANQQQVEQVLAVAKEVQVQQRTIAENQAKIDEKLTLLAENLRVARIYSTRTGGGKK